MHPQMSGASMIEVDDLASAPGEITAAQWRQIVNGATDTAINEASSAAGTAGQAAFWAGANPRCSASHWAASLPMATGKRG
jgi:hypothetical protein